MNWRNLWRHWLGVWRWEGSPWAPCLPGTAETHVWHARARAHLLRAQFPRHHRLMGLLLVLTWPLRLLRQALRLSSRFRQPLQALGVSRMAILRVMLVLGLRHGISPRVVLQFRLFAPDAQPGKWLYPHEAPGLFRALGQGASHARVNDKWLFAEDCRSLGLPAVPVLMRGERGTVVSMAAAWPDGDLVSKPVIASRGEGIIRWVRSGQSHYLGSDGSCMRTDNIGEVLDRCYPASAWLLQPALSTCADLADIVGDGLLTVRLLTRCDAGRVRACAALLKLHRPGAVTNNHAPAAAIELQTGKLGRVCSLRPLQDRHDMHPQTGARVAGRVLPGWDEVVALALRAHGHFADLGVIGWDIALTPSGPLLLEANLSPDVVLHQMAEQDCPGSGSLLSRLV